jgi:hypothetical protein
VAQVVAWHQGEVGEREPANEVERHVVGLGVSDSVGDTSTNQRERHDDSPDQIPHRREQGQEVLRESARSH